LSDFYTHVAIHKNKILVNGYLNGKRYKQEVPYKPYFFTYGPTDLKSAYKTVQGKYVKKMPFDSIYKAKDFYKQYSEVANFEIFGLEKFVYTYINDTFKDNIEYDPAQIMVHNLDIETGKADDGSFAEVEKANGPITLIGIGLRDQRLVFGWKGEYTPKTKNVMYIKCKDEKDMLAKFISFWAHDEFRPDVVTGWAVEKYDIPFIVNRIRLLFGDDAANRLSPWGILREKRVVIKGQEKLIYVPVGVSILDYYDLYIKFKPYKLESYSLDNVAFHETGKRKLDFSEYESLDELCEKNYEKFVDYNITDVDRVAEIDQKNKYLELCYTIAFDAKVNFIDSLTSVLLWDVIIHNYLLSKNIVIPSSARTSPMNIPGAFVKQPDKGLYEWVVSFDLESLYPHLIMWGNISPETFQGHNNWSEVDFENVLNGTFRTSDKNFTQCGNGARFRKDIHGFLPELMHKQFKLRAQYKKKMLELKAAKADEREIQKYWNFQQAKKIQLNSLYGGLANQYFRWYDWRLSSAITMSGQLAIRWIEKRFNSFLNGLLNTADVDYVIAMDTDSCYITLKDYVQKLYPNASHAETIDILARDAETVFQPVIKKGYQEFSEVMNAYENCLKMKRESIIDKAIWTTKKRYILNVWDLEGIRYKEAEVKHVGIEVVRSVIPQKSRDAMKKAIKLIFSGTEADIKQFIAEFWEDFKKSTFDEIAFPRGVNGITKYKDGVTLYKKGTPIHTKASIIYNNMVSTRGLTNKYSLIYDRDKIKFVYLKTPNPSLSPVIAAPRHLPKELNLDKFIDYDLMFEKTFLDPITAILDAIGWNVSDNSTLEGFFE